MPTVQHSTDKTQQNGRWAPSSQSCRFDRIVLIFGYVVRTNTKILSCHFFAISILNPNYDVINDVICQSCRRVMRIAPPAVNHLL